MNIDKAIEIKSRTGEAFENTDPADIDEADRLSIEALKEIQRLRPPGLSHVVKLLPGETEE